MDTNETKGMPAAPSVPEGYALVSKDMLRAWGKLDEVEAACRYPVRDGAQPRQGAAGVPDGWQLVPKKPTPDIEAAIRVNMDYASCTPAQVWHASLAAAPNPESCGACGDACTARGSCRVADESPRPAAPHLINPASSLPAERPCCGTFPRTPHRASCEHYRGKSAAKPEGA